MGNEPYEYLDWEYVEAEAAQDQSYEDFLEQIGGNDDELPF